MSTRGLAVSFHASKKFHFHAPARILGILSLTLNVTRASGIMVASITDSQMHRHFRTRERSNEALSEREKIVTRGRSKRGKQNECAVPCYSRVYSRRFPRVTSQSIRTSYDPAFFACTRYLPRSRQITIACAVAVLLRSSIVPSYISVLSNVTDKKIQIKK